MVNVKDTRYKDTWQELNPWRTRRGETDINSNKKELELTRWTHEQQEGWVIAPKRCIVKTKGLFILDLYVYPNLK